MLNGTTPLQLLDRLYGRGIEYEVASHLIDFLARHAETTYINLQLVRQLTPGAMAGAHDKAIVRTLQFLSGDGVGVLDVGFELFDDEDHAHKISNDEARAALEFHINPLTGEQDADIRRRLAMYFAPAPGAIDSFVVTSTGSGAPD